LADPVTRERFSVESTFPATMVGFRRNQGDDRARLLALICTERIHETGRLPGAPRSWDVIRRQTTVAEFLPNE
jgi:hypothetical protein